MWEIIDTGDSDAEINMKFDASLLEGVREKPILHLYGWKEPSATYGLLVDVDKYLNISEVEKRGLKLAKRPTGGGIIFHEWDFAFSVFVPRSCKFYSDDPIQNYAFVNGIVAKVIHKFTNFELKTNFLMSSGNPRGRFCMASATKYDIMVGNKKVAGAAQRRGMNGFLHQGSIFLVQPEKEYLENILIPGTGVLEAIYANIFPLLGNEADRSLARDISTKLKELFIAEIENE